MSGLELFDTQTFKIYSHSVGCYRMVTSRPFFRSAEICLLLNVTEVMEYQAKSKRRRYLLYHQTKWTIFISKPRKNHSFLTASSVKRITVAV